MAHAWDAAQVARAAGGRLLHPALEDGPGGPGPARAVIDSREAGPGDLFVGLRGEHADGGRFALGALEAGAWGVLVDDEHAEALVRGPDAEPGGAVIAAADPLAALAALARAWRRHLACPVVGITGSTGKTSTKDVLAAMLALDRRVVATPRNWNTEIGLPLTVLSAPEGTEALVLEMAMRGAGQIAELARIAEPDVGLVTNVGPVHLEQLGTIDAIADEKTALLRGLRSGGTAVVPAHDDLVRARVPSGVRTLTFGPGGDVEALPDDLELEFTSAHMRRNALAALAAARAAGAQPRGRVAVALSERRGQREVLADGLVVVDDCYNANPMSMRAALDDLAASAPGRRVAVLGDMLELGADEQAFHEQVGAHAAAAGVDLLLAVGPRSHATAEAFRAAAPAGAEVHHVADAAAAAAAAPVLVAPGDTVLVKASRGVALEAVAAALRASRPVPPARDG
jgi:UDP-N-acetylmuramoyl-tripeptide--D-alanyl-D-alanine ligase